MNILTVEFGVILLPLLGAVLVKIAGRIQERAVPHLAVAVGYLNAMLAVLMVMGGGKSLSLFGSLYLSVVSDGIGAFVSATGAVLGALILTYSLGYMEHEKHLARYYGLTLLLIGSMSGLVLSGNLLTMFLFWLACGFVSFALVGFHKEDTKAQKAVMKAVAVTGLGNIALFSAIVVLYFSTSPHTLDIRAITAQAASIPEVPLALAAFGVLLGATGMSAQIPLHSWLPGAMEAPTSGSALVDAATTLNAGVYLVSRMYPAFHVVSGWTQAVTWVGAITLLYAAFMALRAKDLKIVLAYSSMSQLGYMFAALGMGGLLAAQFHMVSHAVFKALLFLCAGVIIHMAHTRQLDLLSGVGKKMPLTGRCFMLGAMGLSGIPVFSGFFSKDMIFATALHSGQYLPLAVAVVGAVLTFTYTWRTYRKVFCGEPSPAAANAHDARAAISWPLCVLGAGTLLSWLLIGTQSNMLHATLEHVEPISPLHLVEETFASPAFLLSVLVLAVGGGIVWSGRKR